MSGSRPTAVHRSCLCNALGTSHLSHVALALYYITLKASVVSACSTSLVHFPSCIPPRSRRHRHPGTAVASPSVYLYALTLPLPRSESAFGSPSGFPGTIKPTRRAVPTPASWTRTTTNVDPPRSTKVLTKFSILKLTSSELPLFWLKAYVDYARALRPKRFQSRLTRPAVAIHRLALSSMPFLDCLGVIEFDPCSVYSLDRGGFEGLDLKGGIFGLCGPGLPLDLFTLVDQRDFGSQAVYTALDAETIAKLYQLIYATKFNLNHAGVDLYQIQVDDGMVGALQVETLKLSSNYNHGDLGLCRLRIGTGMVGVEFLQASSTWLALA
ncbi:hypothetical protein C8R47DRAFT_1221750 [Mycena vitilis]|nr:hypothetical protein C8R47DRAFT_1221750 [Mycena vitilis]